MNNKAPSLKQLALCISTSLVFLSPVSSAGQDYNNIAFHPVPLSGDPFGNAPGLLKAEYGQDTNLADGSSHAALADGSFHAALADGSFHTPSAEQYRAAIQQIENTSGPFAPAAAQQAESLGDFLANNGGPEGAVEAFEKSRHIHRVNEGLHSPGQVKLLKKIIASEIDAGNLFKAHGLQESLLYLSRKIHAPGDQGYISAIMEWADWNLDLLVMANDAPVNTVTGSGIATLNTQLVTAQENYIEAIEQIRSQPINSSEYKKLLIHAEKKLAAINYIANTKSVFAGGPAGTSAFQESDPFSSEMRRGPQMEIAYFFNGSNALKRGIAYSLEDPQPDYLSIAEQMMALGDWYLLFERRAAALTIYEDAYEVLDAVQASADDISRIMTPGMPVATPDTPYSGNIEPSDFHGYIDVEFSISKFGIASRPEVIATSAQNIFPVTRALIRKIRQEKFRPAFIDGSATSGKNVKLRYYYSYN